MPLRHRPGVKDLASYLDTCVKRKSSPVVFSSALEFLSARSTLDLAFDIGISFSLSESLFDIGTPRRGRAGQKTAIALQETKMERRALLSCRSPVFAGVLPMGNSGYGELDAATLHDHEENNEWLHSKAAEKNTFHDWAHQCRRKDPGTACYETR